MKRKCSHTYTNIHILTHINTHTHTECLLPENLSTPYHMTTTFLHVLDLSFCLTLQAKKSEGVFIFLQDISNNQGNNQEMPMAKIFSCWCLLFSVMASLTSTLTLTMCSSNGWNGPRYGPRKCVPIGVSHQGLTILLAIIIGPGNPDLSQSACGIFPGTRISSFSTDLKQTNQGSCCWFRAESRSWMRTRKHVAQEVTS